MFPKFLKNVSNASRKRISGTKHSSKEMPMRKKHTRAKRPQTSWDPLASWYDGWVGKGGSKHHRKLAIPAVMELLNAKPGEKILDVGAGQGVLAPFIVKTGAHYWGVEISEQMLKYARRHHAQIGKFIRGDACRLSGIPELQPEFFDAVVYLLSIQDIDPLQDALEAGSWALKTGGRAILLMTHPCFRIPRQSGWGWDENRKLRYRRIDRYLTPLPVPLKPFPGQRGVSRSYHRSLQTYANGLAEQGLLIEQIRELPTYKVKTSGTRSRAENLSNKEIPLFLGIRAVKIK